MNSQPIILRICILILCLPFSIQARIIYVNQSAGGSNTGLSWLNAFTSVQTAIEFAASGDSIWVAQGVYTPSKDPFWNPAPANIRDLTFLLKYGVKMFGGFQGGETSLNQRDINAYPTVLSGQKSASVKVYHVVMSVADNVNTVLDGFTISNGRASGSGTIVVEGRSANRGTGGGIYSIASAATFRNLTILDCYGVMGAAVCNEESTSTYSDMEMYQNDSPDGGAFGNIAGNILIQRCIMRDNTGINGGAICNSAATVRVINCVMFGNSVYDKGGAIFNMNSSFTMINSSVAYNHAPAGGGGLHSEGASSSTNLTNCIVWANTGNLPQSISLAYGATASATYSDIDGAVQYPGTGNILGDPLFVAPNNLMIMVGSPCIDAGTNTGAPTTDIAGSPRPQGGTVDMGAYETPELMMFVFMGYVNEQWFNHENWNTHYCPPVNYEGQIMIGADCVIPAGSQIGNGCEIIIESGRKLSVK